MVMALANSPVSLVITVYDREQYLALAIDSILAQTYPHWSLIIWDDGSTDSSPDIARKYTNIDTRIKFIGAPHLGRAQALKRAIWAGTGKYLGWLDSDDLLDREALAVTVDILDRHPQVGMVYSDYLLIDEDGGSTGVGSRCQIPYSKERLLVDFMTFHFRLMRREVYNLVGGIDLDFPQAQDYDLCLKISEIAEISHCPSPLYFYRTHPHQISSSQKERQTERAAAAVKNALVRRGLSDRYYLDWRDGRFRILAKRGHLD